MLTRRQRDVLVFITNYQKREGGVSPSCDDIRIGLGLKSRGRIPLILKALEERGFIRRMAHRNRAISVIRAAPGGKEPPTTSNRIPIFDAETLQLRGYLP